MGLDLATRSFYFGNAFTLCGLILHITFLLQNRVWLSSTSDSLKLSMLNVLPVTLRKGQAFFNLKSSGRNQCFFLGFFFFDGDK